MKHALFLFLANLVFLQAQSQELSTTVYFESNEWTLTEESRSRLDSLRVQLDRYQNVRVRIEAHTDNVGSDSANVLLSEKRARTVQANLVEWGMEGIQMEIVWHGEANPVSSNEEGEGRSENRRVEIFAVGWKNPLDSLAVESVSDITDLLKDLTSMPQQFCITPDKDTVLVCDQGTLIYIKANSFILGPEYLGGCIQMEVKEVFEISEMLYENLTTLSDTAILQSSSMLKIDAFSNGAPLTMRQDLLVMAPGRYPGDSTIALYDGIRGEDGNINWSPMDNPFEAFNGELFGECDYLGLGSSPIAPCPFFFCKIKKFFAGKNWQNSDSLQVTRGDDCSESEEERLAFEKKYEGFSTDQLKDIPREDVTYYVFTRRLGWSNTDWMMKVKRKKDFFVKIDPNDNLQLKVVFPTRRTVVPLRASRGRYYHKDLPKGMDVWIVGLKFEEDVPKLALLKTRIGDPPVTSLSFEAYGIEELKEKLTLFD